MSMCVGVWGPRREAWCVFPQSTGTVLHLFPAAEGGGRVGDEATDKEKGRKYRKRIENSHGE